MNTVGTMAGRGWQLLLGQMRLQRTCPAVFLNKAVRISHRRCYSTLGPQSEGALTGVKVLDLSRVLAVLPTTLAHTEKD